MFYGMTPKKSIDLGRQTVYLPRGQGYAAIERCLALIAGNAAFVRTHPLNLRTKFVGKVIEEIKLSIAHPERNFGVAPLYIASNWYEHLESYLLSMLHRAY
jgi:hypothetical protein